MMNSSSTGYTFALTTIEQEMRTTKHMEMFMPLKKTLQRYATIPIRKPRENLHIHAQIWVASMFQHYPTVAN